MTTPRPLRADLAVEYLAACAALALCDRAGLPVTLEWTGGAHVARFDGSALNEIVSVLASDAATYRPWWLWGWPSPDGESEQDLPMDIPGAGEVGRTALDLLTHRHAGDQVRRQYDLNLVYAACAHLRLTSGQQRYLDAVRACQTAATAEAIEEAMTGRASPVKGPTLRLWPGAGQPTAQQARVSPHSSGVPALEWLAWRGATLIRVDHGWDPREELRWETWDGARSWREVAVRSGAVRWRRWTSIVERNRYGYGEILPASPGPPPPPPPSSVGWEMRSDHELTVIGSLDMVAGALLTAERRLIELDGECRP